MGKIVGGRVGPHSVMVGVFSAREKGQRLPRSEQEEEVRRHGFGLGKANKILIAAAKTNLRRKVRNQQLRTYFKIPLFSERVLHELRPPS